jgi:hypothetical protein
LVLYFIYFITAKREKGVRVQTRGIVRGLETELIDIRTALQAAGSA